METKVYKSLDKPSVLFGVRGSFIVVVLAFAGAGVLLGLLLMVFLSPPWFFVVFVLSAGAGVAVTLVLQSRMTEGQARRRLAMVGLRRFWLSPVGKISLKDADEVLKK